MIRPSSWLGVLMMILSFAFTCFDLFHPAGHSDATTISPLFSPCPESITDGSSPTSSVYTSPIQRHWTPAHHHRLPVLHLAITLGTISRSTTTPPLLHQPPYLLYLYLHSCAIKMDLDDHMDPFFQQPILDSWLFPYTPTSPEYDYRSILPHLIGVGYFTTPLHHSYQTRRSTAHSHLRAQKIQTLGKCHYGVSHHSSPDGSTLCQFEYGQIKYPGMMFSGNST
eukprot:489116-Prorocentrum_minimum.AAC.2